MPVERTILWEGPPGRVEQEKGTGTEHSRGYGFEGCFTSHDGLRGMNANREAGDQPPSWHPDQEDRAKPNTMAALRPGPVCRQLRGSSYFPTDCVPISQQKPGVRHVHAGRQGEKGCRKVCDKSNLGIPTRTMCFSGAAFALIGI